MVAELDYRHAQVASANVSLLWNLTWALGLSEANEVVHFMSRLELTQAPRSIHSVSSSLGPLGCLFIVVLIVPPASGSFGIAMMRPQAPFEQVRIPLSFNISLLSERSNYANRALSVRVSE